MARFDKINNTKKQWKGASSLHFRQYPLAKRHSRPYPISSRTQDFHPCPALTSRHQHHQWKRILITKAFHFMMLQSNRHQPYLNSLRIHQTDISIITHTATATPMTSQTNLMETMTQAGSLGHTVT